MIELETPYIWFGGKRKVAPIIWEIIGDVPNYVEPFLGSASVLLARPHEPKDETVNDFDGFVSNFWRSVQSDPLSVAKYCDWPVNETDLVARQNWLVRQNLSNELTGFRQKMFSDPEYYNPKIAGWWCWGLCNWVGGGFAIKEVEIKMPAVLDRGVLTDDRIRVLYEFFIRLQQRLRFTHVACGDWSRVVSPTITYKRGLTGVVLDPPYGEGSMDYSAGGNKDSYVAKAVQKWAVENGDNENLRIVYCGYEGQFNPPSSWRVIEWKAQGGYGGGKGTEADVNSYRERIWCSPSCLGPKQNVLFSDLGKKIIPVKIENPTNDLSKFSLFGEQEQKIKQKKHTVNSTKKSSASNAYLEMWNKHKELLAERKQVDSFQISYVKQTTDTIEKNNNVYTSKLLEEIDNSKERSNSEENNDLEKMPDLSGLFSSFSFQSTNEEKQKICICGDDEPDLGCPVHFDQSEFEPF